MADEALPRDPSGSSTDSNIDDATGELIGNYGDGTAHTKHSSNWVWNADTLVWDKMTQPVIETNISSLAP